MTRKYIKITDQQRHQLVEVKNQGHTIKDAAKLVDIPYENAKAIMRVYRREMRTNKHTVRNRFKTPKHEDPILNVNMATVTMPTIPIAEKLTFPINT